MMTDSGRVSGSREPDPSCTGSGPSGFDLARGAIHMRNGRVVGRGETWCGKKLLGGAVCDGDGIETFNVYGADVHTTYDEPFVTCQRCLDAFESSYRAAFPDGPKPIATIHADNPRAKEVLGPETMARFFGPNGEGAEAYERFIVAIATEAGTDETTQIGSIRRTTARAVRHRPNPSKEAL